MSFFTNSIPDFYNHAIVSSSDIRKNEAQKSLHVLNICSILKGLGHAILGNFV